MLFIMHAVLQLYVCYACAGICMLYLKNLNALLYAVHTCSSLVWENSFTSVNQLIPHLSGLKVSSHLEYPEW